MNTMQQELRDTYPLLRIQLVGVNEKGQEAGNPSMTSGRNLPWLQDVDANSNAKSDVWYDSWNVTFRDVVILDGTNAKVGVYNVTANDLSNASNYATLRGMLVDAAMASQLPWRNPDNALDVNNRDAVNPLDALVVINRLNSVGPGELPPPVANQSPPPFYDVSGDNEVTALDALQVINFLNGNTTASAGEGEETASASKPTAELAQPIAAVPYWAADGPTRREDQPLGRQLTPPLEEVQESMAATDWRSVDLAFESKAPSESSNSTPSGKTAGPNESWELDDWWLAPYDTSRSEAVIPS
jgi:hypothetical protein